MRNHTSGHWVPLAGSSTRRRKQRILRTVCIFQLLGFLTCSGLLTTLWLMARLEASYEANGLRIFVGEQQLPEQIIQKEVEEELIRDPPGIPWSPPLPKRQKSVDPKKQHTHNPMKLPRFNQSTPSSPLPPSFFFPPLPSSLNYLGVMIDAGRYYFPPPWLYQQLQYFHSLGYNYIHFRLTDDQNFVLNLTIPSEILGGKNITGASLAFVARREQEQESLLDPDDANGRKTSNLRSVVYQPEELSKFVRFAKYRYNITVIPEVNVPGHAGAWGANDALPDFVVSCPEFACSMGYGVPLNVTHPKLPKLLKHILTQVVEIFDHPPFLHLGGDELHMSGPCLQEAGITNPSSWIQESVLEFEHGVLRPILEDLGYGPHQILRWENKHQPQIKDAQQHRFGGITHYWETKPSAATNVGRMNHDPFVISTGLYLDVVWYDRVYGYGDFQTAQKLVSDHESNPPLAIVVGTFELGIEFWEDRNVLGRLLAIRMGVAVALSTGSPSPAMPKPPTTNSIVPRTQQGFKTEYMTKCNAIFSKHQSFPCENFGWPLLEDRRFEAKWKLVWKEWKDGLCEGLTYLEQSIHIKSSEVYAGLQHSVNEYYWDNLLSSLESPGSSRHPLDRNFRTSASSSSSIPNVGIAIDLVRDPLSQEEYFTVLQKIESLGINLIQLNLADDFGQVVEYNSIPKAGYYPASAERNQPDEKVGFALYDRHRLEQMVEWAHKVGIRLVPEINLATNGGGWYKTGVLMDCPKVLCDDGNGIAFDVVNKIESVIPIVLAAILELRDVFSSSPFHEFLHLGSDQREAAIDGCFAEAGHAASEAHSALHRFERRLSESLSLVGVDQKQIIRWHNREKVDYPDRVGKITHYTDVVDAPKESKNGSTASPFFGTVLLKDGMTPWDVYRETLRWTSNPSTPRGIVAKTIHGKIPRLDQLVAFAMGLGLTTERNGLPTTPDDFQRHFELVCVRFECNSTMEPFGKATGLRPTIRQATSMESCTDRTFTATLRRSRAFLLPGGELSW